MSDETAVTTVSEIITLESTETLTTVAVPDLSNLSGIDVDMLNAFTYLGTAFVIGFFFFFVCKGVYKLFNMFF